MYTVLRALSPEIFNFKGFEHRLMEFPLLHLKANSWTYAITATCGRGENVVRVRERLKTKIQLFFSQYLFCILISLSQNPIKTN